MGCRLAIRRIGWGLPVLLAVLQTGCAGPADGRPPEEMLSIASSGLEGVDRYTFRSRTAVRSGGVELQELESYEGEISGHAVRMIRGLSDGSARAAEAAATPAARLAELAKLEAEIDYAGEAPEGCVALELKLSGEAAARDIRARLTRQFELAAERAASGLAGADPGSADAADGADAGDARRAVAEETARFRRELARMLESLEAETTVLVTVDRKSMLPLALDETSALRYAAGGRTRTEEWATRTTLGGFDGRPSSS